MTRITKRLVSSVIVGIAATLFATSAMSAPTILRLEPDPEADRPTSVSRR